MNVSVVIATHKRPHLLKKTLDCLAAQQFPKAQFEIIVVIDGPDEETAHLFQEYKSHLPNAVPIVSPQNQGPAVARNIGWSKARGKLIIFTDDDCLPAPEWISNYWAAFTSNTSNDVVAYSGRVVVPINDPPTDYEKNIKQLESAEFITANCACSRVALQITGGFDEAFSMAWREDSDLQFKMIKLGISIHKVDNAVVIHPVRKARWGVSIREQRKSMFNALLLKRHPALYREKIKGGAPWNYYVIVVSFLLFVSFASLQNILFMTVSFIVWLAFTLKFTATRLVQTSHSAGHVVEMIVTSMVIPFLSVYWNLYGAIKFKTFFMERRDPSHPPSIRREEVHA